MRPTRTQGQCGVIALALGVALAVLPAAQADFQVGMEHLKSAKYLEAAGEFQALVDANPDYADGFHLLGVCFLHTRKFADAERNFLEAIELNGDKFEYHFNLAKTYQAQNKLDKLIGTLNNAEGLANSQKMKQLLYHLRGNALASQKKWDEAIDDLERSLAIQPDPGTQTQLGKAYYMLGDQQAAVTALRKAVKEKPTADTYELIVGGMLDLAAKAQGDAAKRKYGEALAEARRFLDFDPSSFAARYLIGRAALGAGKYDDAISSFQDVLRKKSDHCRAMTNMGTSFSAKSDWANALTALENATRCDPKLNLAWQTKGFVLQKTASATSDPTKKQQAYQDAIDAYRKALEIKPSSSITAKIEACEQNIRVSRQNQGMASEEAANLAAIEEEKRRVAEEERKRLEWKKTQEEDD